MADLSPFIHDWRIQFTKEITFTVLNTQFQTGSDETYKTRAEPSKRTPRGDRAAERGYRQVSHPKWVLMQHLFIKFIFFFFLQGFFIRHSTSSAHTLLCVYFEGLSLPLSGEMSDYWAAVSDDGMSFILFNLLVSIVSSQRWCLIKVCTRERDRERAFVCVCV